MKRGETLGFDVESFSSSACTHSVRLSHSVQSTQAQRQRWGGVIACLILVHHHTQTHTNLIRKQLVSHLFTITHSHTYTQTHTKTLSGSNLVTGVPPLERRNVRGVPSHVIPAVLTNFLLSVCDFRLRTGQFTTRVQNTGKIQFSKFEKTRVLDTRCRVQLRHLVLR